MVSDFKKSGRAGDPLPAAKTEDGAHGVTRPAEIEKLFGSC